MKPVDFTIYWKETPVVQVCYDAMKQPQFTVLDHSHLPVLLFGMDGKAVPTAARLDKFFADRCFPSTRQNAKELLAIAGLTLYQLVIHIDHRFFHGKLKHLIVIEPGEHPAGALPCR